MQLDLEGNRKVYVIMNPVAGTNAPEVVREAVQNALTEQRFECEIYETTGKEDVKQIVRAAIREGYKLFMAVGGDGTIAAVANGLVGTGIPFVVIPAGTWNALARALDIPLQLDQALALMFQEHQVREIDMMQVGNNSYILNISAGIGSRTMTYVTREDKRRFGKFYDLWNGLHHILSYQDFRFDVTIDGKHQRLRASEIMVANCRIIALKAIELDPDIRMDDSKMHLCRIYASSLRDYLSLTYSMLTGRQKQDWRVRCIDAFDEVEIRSRHRLPIQADGDLIGYLPLKVKLQPKAVRIVTPVDAKL
jgi:diacylglycerol kinase (ATP)